MSTEDCPICPDSLTHKINGDALMCPSCGYCVSGLQMVQNPNWYRDAQETQRDLVEAGNYVGLEAS